MNWSNVTFNQKIAMLLVALSVLTAGGSASDLATLVGPGVAKIIIAASNILQAMMAGWLAIFTGQQYLVKDVVKMANDPASPIQGIVTTATQKGKDLAASIRGPIVSAGSAAATDIAKP